MFLSTFYILTVSWVDNMKEHRITNMAGFFSIKSHISPCRAECLCSVDILRSVYVLRCCLLQIRPVAWVICCRSSHQQLEELNRFSGTLPALLQGSFAIPSVQFTVFNDALYFYWILISQCWLMRRMETKAKVIGGGDEKSVWLCYTCCKRGGKRIAIGNQSVLTTTVNQQLQPTWKILHIFLESHNGFSAVSEAFQPWKEKNIELLQLFCLFPFFHWFEEGEDTYSHAPIII